MGRIMEPIQFNPKWYYSCKFCGLYEIGISIHIGNTVWGSRLPSIVNWTGLKHARNIHISYALKPREIVWLVKWPNNQQIKQIFSRHETVNGRFNNFAVLKILSVMICFSSSFLSCYCKRNSINAWKWWTLLRNCSMTTIKRTLYLDWSIPRPSSNRIF